MEIDPNTETDKDKDTGDGKLLVDCGTFSPCESRNGIELGYQCKNRVCTKCKAGTYGTDGRKCNLCPFGQWTIKEGETRCYSSFSYSTVGSHTGVIPFGVSQIIVSLWGGGGGGEQSLDNAGLVAHAGGGGGFLSCNVTVSNIREIQIIVGGGGKARSNKINLGGRV